MLQPQITSSTKRHVWLLLLLKMHKETMFGKHYREQWREERMFMKNMKNSMIVEGKKSEHCQTFSVTTE